MGTYLRGTSLVPLKSVSQLLSGTSLLQPTEEPAQQRLIGCAWSGRHTTTHEHLAMDNRQHLSLTLAWYSGFTYMCAPETARGKHEKQRIRSCDKDGSRSSPAAASLRGWRHAAMTLCVECSHTAVRIRVDDGQSSPSLNQQQSCEDASFHSWFSESWTLYLVGDAHRLAGREELNGEQQQRTNRISEQIIAEKMSRELLNFFTCGDTQEEGPGRGRALQAVPGTFFKALPVLALRDTEELTDCVVKGLRGFRLPPPLLVPR